MKDMIIGCFTNYDWTIVQYWANSVELSGFRGDRVVVFHNTDQSTLDRLVARQFYTHHFDPVKIAETFAYSFDFDVMLHRFLVYYDFLANRNIEHYRYIIATDVRDVVFQQDPSLWLQEHLGEKKICASAESLLYRDQPWNQQSMLDGYPSLYNQMELRPIWNAGVQAGDIQVMRDFWLQLGMIGAAGFAAADQCAYNILLSLKPWSEITLFTNGEDGWACQANTQARPNPALLEATPVWDGHHSTTSTGKRHVILHQYTSFEDWRASVQTRYGDDEMQRRRVQPIKHPNDIDEDDLAFAITNSERPQLLNEIVGISRRALGFYTAHFPHTINYPWAAGNLESFTAGSRLLDIGTGLSPLPLWLAERGLLVDCVDSHAKVRVPPATPDWNEWGFFDYALLHPNLRAHHCTISDFTPIEKFDAIYSISVVAHMPQAVRKEMLRRYRSWLRHEGLLLLAIDIIPFSDFLWNRSEGAEVESALKHGTIQDVLGELCAAGFLLSEAKVLRAVYKSRTDLLFLACTSGSRAP